MAVASSGMLGRWAVGCEVGDGMLNTSSFGGPETTSGSWLSSGSHCGESSSTKGSTTTSGRSLVSIPIGLLNDSGP